jgi:hypothetical protein
MQAQHITIPVNPCKQCGANLQGVVPNPHTPYVHAKHEIDQSQVSLLTPKVLQWPNFGHCCFGQLGIR